MSDREYSRRTILRRSAATAGAAGLVSTAGCSSIPNPFGGGAPYTSWLPAPDELGDADHYRFNYINMGQVESNEDEFDDESFDLGQFEELWTPLDFDWEDVSHFTTFGGFFGLGGGYAIEADYNLGDATSTLEDEDFEEDSEYNGYTIMLTGNGQQAYAVDGSAVIITSATEESDSGTPSGGNTDRVETIIDAKKGNTDRYGDASDDMSTLTGALGGGTIVSGGTMEEPEEESVENGQFENMVAEGQRVKVNGDTANAKYVIVYESSDDVDTGDLEEWVGESDGNDGQFEDLDDPSYSSNGRKGVITGTVNTDDL